MSLVPGRDVTELSQILNSHGQSHLLRFYDELESDQQEQLISDIHDIYFPKIHKVYNEVKSAVKDPILHLEPPAPVNCGSALTASSDELQHYEDLGIKAISEGKVAIILLAGGSGTRLGVTYPKGMYDVGLPSNKSLYQLQAEKLLRLIEYAREVHAKEAVIYWYIMTSDFTKRATIDYFEEKNYFGIDRRFCVFFEQFTFPALTIDGNVILEKKHKVFRSPDGNGGLFRAVREMGILDHMHRHGVEHLHVYAIDNILVKVADPLFIGFCIHKGAECGAKVVEKIQPTESVGVIARIENRYRVIEYSEINAEIANERLASTSDDSLGPLLYRSGSICNHYFSMGFLQRVCQTSCEEQLRYHIAYKKVPYVDLWTGEQVMPVAANAIKMEKFVFDVFPYAETFAIWEVDRSTEFSPLKNAPSAQTDNPMTCRTAYLEMHRQLLLQQGHRIPPTVEVEISTTMPYSKMRSVALADPLPTEGTHHLCNVNGQFVLVPA